jgi:hypothetical protein
MLGLLPRCLSKCFTGVANCVGDEATVAVVAEEEGKKERVTGNVYAREWREAEKRRVGALLVDGTRTAISSSELGAEG